VPLLTVEPVAETDLRRLDPGCYLTR
jgi:hypothetical protein